MEYILAERAHHLDVEDCYAAHPAGPALHADHRIVIAALKPKHHSTQTSPSKTQSPTSTLPLIPMPIPTPVILFLARQHRLEFTYSHLVPTEPRQGSRLEWLDAQSRTFHRIQEKPQAYPTSFSNPSPTLRNGYVLESYRCRRNPQRIPPRAKITPAIK